jgi:hypothetical protein
LVVEQGKPHNWNRSENNIVKQVYELLIDESGRVDRENSKPKVREDHDNVLVEVVAHEESISPVGFSTMLKEKLL